jgi:hypothetical protein
LTAALVVSRQKSHMRTAINPITARMVQIIFGHLPRRVVLIVRTRQGRGSHMTTGCLQHSLFAWMQLWIRLLRDIWFHALKKSACMV